jgi:hypothetical protein
MYQRNRLKFVYHENPLHLNERLTIQQGVFLCPGDISSSFLDNLLAMSGWESEKNIVKVRLTLDGGQVRRFAKTLKGMNLGSAALFPDLDGFARSLGEHLLHYEDLAKRRIGLPG